mmetsp:Transcript_10764/g.14215  ORF Transcript_10764/g.14215 Transcript_10764/m.14215 type:complete len:89 (+) Transcript_10764:355-621(+)
MRSPAGECVLRTNALKNKNCFIQNEKPNQPANQIASRKWKKSQLKKSQLTEVAGHCRCPHSPFFSDFALEFTRRNVEDYMAVGSDLPK